MAKITRWLAKAMLEKANPGRADLVHLYLDQFMAYIEANDQLAAAGSVITDPKSGQPVQNPYLIARQAARRAMLEMRQVKGTGGLWSALEDEVGTAARPK
jgi:phage terminase small subunit